MKRLLLAAVLALFVAPAAASASVTVNTAADHADDGCAAAPGDCTLREAINTPPPDGLIIVPARTYTIDSELIVDNEMEIRGAGARTTTIQHTGGIDRVMLIESGLTSVTISGVRITGGNDDENDGGGINVGAASTLHLFDSAVEDNTGQSGGGIWSAGTLDIRRTTIARNRALGSSDPAGGGIRAVAGGSTTLENTTVSRNIARNADSIGLGGGIYTAANLDLRNVTITENEAGTGVRSDGGGLFQEFGGGPLRTKAHNIVIARNVGLNCWGTANDQVEATNSVSDEAAIPGGPSCNASLPTNQLVSDARLGPLANNGGPTDTHALLTGSPGIDKGGAPCPATDQRGISRPRGAACDAGAYELVPAPSPPPPDEPLPPPKPGKTINALTKSGTVKVKLPGTSRFVVLGEGRQIPVNTVVDTRKGRVTLVAAANKKGGTATAVFYDGLFKLTQSKGARPITTLTLVEKLTGCKAKGSAAAAKKKVKKRRLWGDGKGRFRTKGRNSAATVLGTKWLVEDRCTSTLTKVARGKVSVRDFVKRKTVLVKAGKKYVARAR